MLHQEAVPVELWRHLRLGLAINILLVLKRSRHQGWEALCVDDWSGRALQLYSDE